MTSRFDIDKVLEEHNNLIKPVFTQNPRCLEFALSTLCDFDPQTRTFSRNDLKAYKSLALALLYVKEHFYLKEFFKALEEALTLAFDDLSFLSIAASDFDASANLYEGYKEHDLSFLKGKAVIIPSGLLRTFNQSDDFIRVLDVYSSPEFFECQGEPMKVLEQLFEIKDKWSKEELKPYLEGIVEKGSSLDSFLLKSARMIKEKNPFDSSKDINLYIKKF